MIRAIQINLRRFVYKLNPRDRSITLTKLLIKHAKFTQKEIEIGAQHNPVLNKCTSAKLNGFTNI